MVATHYSAKRVTDLEKAECPGKTDMRDCGAGSASAGDVTSGVGRHAQNPQVTAAADPTRT